MFESDSDENNLLKFEILKDQLFAFAEFVNLTLLRWTTDMITNSVMPLLKMPRLKHSFLGLWSCCTVYVKKLLCVRNQVIEENASFNLLLGSAMLVVGTWLVYLWFLR